MDYNVISTRLLFFILSLISIYGVSNLSEAYMAPTMCVFGGSLVDVGNNNYLKFSSHKANYPYHGIDFPSKIATGRFCNGKNIGVFLAFKLRKSRKLFLTSANFASGGSGIMNQTNKLFSLSLTGQVDCFLAVHKAQNKQLGPTGAYKHLSKSLFLIVTGSNDIFSYFGSDDLQNKTTPLQYVNLMSVTLKGQIKRLRNLAALKFVFVGTGVVGCIPSARNKNKGYNEEVNHWCIKYNEALNSMLRSLKFELQGINYFYFDGYVVMQSVIQKPAAYGFSEVKAACCGLGKLRADVPCLPFSRYCTNRFNHLFWDGSHPTEAAHRIFVDHNFYGPVQYTLPVNVKKLSAI